MTGLRQTLSKSLIVSTGFAYIVTATHCDIQTAPLIHCSTDSAYVGHCYLTVMYRQLHW